MALPSKPTESVSNSIDKGVYLSKGRITDVKDLSNHPNYKKPADQVVKVKRKDKGGNLQEVPVDLCLEITYLTEQSEERSFRLFGDFVKDLVDGRVTNWKSVGNQVSTFLFTICEEAEVTKFVRDDMSINGDVLKSIISGKVFKEVKYVTGTYQKDGQTKMSTKSWKFFKHDDEDEYIASEWETAKMKDSYVKRMYKPDVVDVLSSQKSDIDTVFPYGANAADEDPI